MTDEEVFRLAEERRRRTESAPVPPNIATLLDDAVAKAGDEQACLFFEDDQGMSHRELRDSVRALASALNRLGVAKGSPVGVMLPNAIEFPITWLAIGTLGAVMVPINIGYTGDELSYVLNDSEAEYLVIDETCLPTFEGMPNRPAALRDDRIVVRGGAEADRYHGWSALAASGDSAFSVDWDVGPDDLLNIQYTSGTTGFPKGCMLSQRYWLLIGRTLSMQDDPPLRRILVAQPFYYMDPQWMLIWALFVGGTIFVARRASASRFMDWARTWRAEYCIFPEVVMKQPPSAADRDHCLRRVNIFGWSRQAHMEAEDRFGFVAREAYGMTEIGAGLYTPVEATHMVGSGTCGIPAPYRECAVFDDDGSRVAPTEIGELWVRGDSIFKGYYRKPEANADSFRDDWFRTGDLFRQDESGWFYIVGRKKDMIRRSGENISAQEVEAVLRGLPDVAEAAAVPVPDAYRKEEVKAYLVLQPGVSQDDLPPEQVLAHCAEHLARFKVPRYLEYVDELPKTPSMKIAKHVLVAERDDLRSGSYDRVDACWR